MYIRYSIAILICTTSIAGIVAIFWENEYRYALPTPLPVEYRPVLVGTDLSSTVEAINSKGTPVFVHFYNPDCPCSRFNAKHLRALISTYEQRANIVIVVDSEDSKHAAQREFGEQARYYVDHSYKIAKACGVYSTPQAAIIDAGGKLYYRGNYNKARYCTARETNYAELALIALLNHQSPPEFGLFASQSYGCELSDEVNPYALSIPNLNNN